MHPVLEQRVQHCCAELCRCFAWVEKAGYRERYGCLQIIVLHSYPSGVDIRKLVRAYVRQWIPRAIQIELSVISGDLESYEIDGAVQTAMTGQIL